MKVKTFHNEVFLLQSLFNCNFGITGFDRKSELGIEYSS